jgi:hypothetical protein
MGIIFFEDQYLHKPVANLEKYFTQAIDLFKKPEF